MASISSTHPAPDLSRPRRNAMKLIAFVVEFQVDVCFVVLLLSEWFGFDLCGIICFDAYGVVGGRLYRA